MKLGKPYLSNPLGSAAGWSEAPELASNQAGCHFCFPSGRQKAHSAFLSKENCPLATPSTQERKKSKRDSSYAKKAPAIFNSTVDSIRGTAFFEIVHTPAYQSQLYSGNLLQSLENRPAWSRFPPIESLLSTPIEHCSQMEKNSCSASKLRPKDVEHIRCF